MALSDVSVKVNLVTSAGVEPVWFPLLLVVDSGDPNLSKSIPYTECTSLQQLEELIAEVNHSDSKSERKAKLEKARKTLLYQSAYYMFLQENHPNRFAVVNTGSDGGKTFDDVRVCLEPYLDKSWRQLVLATGMPIQKRFQILEWIENLEQRKMVFLGTSNDNATYNDSEAGKMYALSDYTRTVAVLDTDSHAIYAMIGAVSGKTPGSINYRNVVVQGVAPTALTEGELEQLHANGIMALVERGGDVVTSCGKSASGNRYIDTIDIEDYVVEQLIYNTQKALNVNDIVPYNNDGISILENAAVSVMRDCADKGMIAKTDTNTYEYEVNYPAISYVPEEDIASRTYKLGTVSFTVQGAVDKVEITVDMTL